MRFDDRLRERLSANLAGHDRLAVPAEDRSPAAVVLTVHEHAGEAGFLITRRAVRMSSHSSQWALPGGRLDPGETVVEAALRELDEELGVREVEVLGVLDDYATRSGYRITPVVAWAPAGVDPVPNPAEVAEVHHVPLADLDRPDVPRWAQVPELARPVIQIPIVGTFVHAPTGAVIFQFREVAVHGRFARVDHLDEPPFAWR